MSTIAELIDSQNDTFILITEAVSKFKNLRTERRNPEVIKRLFEALIPVWDQFRETHDKLMAYGELVPDEYFVKTAEVAAFRETIGQFVAAHAPTVLEGKMIGDFLPPLDVENSEESDDEPVVDNTKKKSNTEQNATVSTAANPSSSTTANVTENPLLIAPLPSVQHQQTASVSEGRGSSANSLPPGSVHFGHSSGYNMAPKPTHTEQPSFSQGGAQNGEPVYRYVPNHGFVPVNPDQMGTAVNSQSSGFQNPQSGVTDSRFFQNPQSGGTDSRLEGLLQMVAETHNKLAHQSFQAPRQEESHYGQFRMVDIKIPPFDGDVMKFKTFEETFTKVFDERYSPIQKFVHLRSLLKGAALEAVDSLSLTAPNYNEAWKKLKSMFDNPRVLIESNILSLMNAPETVPKKGESILKFMTTYQSALSNLQTLNVDIHNEVYVVLILLRLDKVTAGRFELSLQNTTSVPTVAMLNNFLEKEYAICHRRSSADTLRPEFKEKEKDRDGKKAPMSYQRAPAVTRTHATLDAEMEAPMKRPAKCFICTGPHMTTECPGFLQSTNREALLRHYKLCIYCVKHRFNYKKPCLSRESLRCGICQEQHITEMHPNYGQAGTAQTGYPQIQAAPVQFVPQCVPAQYPQQQAHPNQYAPAQMYQRTPASMQPQQNSHSYLTFSPVEEVAEEISGAQETVNSYLCKNESEVCSEVYLPRAIVPFETPTGETVHALTAFDNCSQSCYVSEHFVQKMGYKKKKTDVQIFGVGGITGKAQSMVVLKMKTSDPNHPIIKVKALVVKQVTGKLPAYPGKVDLQGFSKPLADPEFDKPAYIPILLGSNILPELMCDGVEKRGGLLFQNTIFGWIVSGKAPGKSNSCTSSFVTLTEFETSLFDFWNMPLAKEETDVLDEDFCEKLYREQHSRSADGRYTVPTPWKEAAPQLADSYSQAVRFYLGQEGKWYQDDAHKQASDLFMDEYIKLGHMTPIPRELQQDRSGNSYYIRYFSILRKDALTTKLRNVFDASAKSSNGVSLNQLIHPGPKLQTHIFDILTRVRQFEFLFSSDVTKMYRQISLQEKDKNFHRIIYRPNRNAELGEYWLNTVTYGLDCAPWQAIRTLHQLADDNAPDEETKEILKTAFYMDDLFYGGDSIPECKDLIQKISATMEAGKFPLTKWVANDMSVLADIEESKKINSYIDLESTTNTIKTLGLLYDPNEDAFKFNIKVPKKIGCTKRELLSIAASFYDPLGWGLPFIMKLRILLQSLWALKYGWDDIIEESIQRQFEKCLLNISVLSSIKIPRWTGNAKGTKIQLVGFCDASADAYAAVVYSRVATANGFEIRLLASRGHVTPLKSRISDEQKKLCTIPKLELEGIVLLCDLLKDVAKTFVHLEVSVLAFTDSEVALAWVRNNKDIENKFVKRRINKIRKFLKPIDLNYVKSAENPADPASRGMVPEKFVDCQLWHQGPYWLKNSVLPVTPFSEPISTICNLTKDDEDKESFIVKFSSWRRMQRVVAICLRFLNKLSRVRDKKIGPLSASEILTAKHRILQFQQRKSFTKEIESITNKKRLPKRHWLVPLTPTFDDGFLRVGGRLGYSNIPGDQKHPIVLPKGHLSDIIIRETHENEGHCGNTLTENFIRQEYWIPALQQRVKKCIRGCMLCTRLKARRAEPIMGDLPSERVTVAPTFSRVGVDFCGFFNVKPSSLRFDRVIKVYVALFVCLFTKAVHLEICTDLSTDNFMGAFTRFCGRRGVPTIMYSDNGTNFVGANNKLQQGWKRLTDEVKDRLALRQITWKFIPSYSPNYGGLWESGVRTLKFFLTRMANVEKLTLEEFQTLLCRIEALMNSRPLFPNPSDPAEGLALTPFHLITQRSVKIAPMDLISWDKTPVSKRWLVVQEVTKACWERLKTEYFQMLQKRYKWKHPTRNIKVDDLVLIEDKASKPGDWRLGKVLKVHMDSKGTAREADIKTNQKESVRLATRRLVPLLEEEVGEEEKLVLRRSQRLREKKVALSTLALFCWLAVSVPINALDIKPLGPGIHLEKLGNVSYKAFDLDFAVKTNVNVTTDLTLIAKTVDDFRTFCIKYEKSNFTNILHHCRNLESSLEEESREIILGIKDSYKLTRSKRFTAFLGKKAVEKAFQYGPTLFLTGEVIYQSFENSRLEANIKELKDNMVKITGQVVNMTDIEFQQVNAKLNAHREVQEAILLEREITDYCSGIQILLTTIFARHQNIHELRPMEDLQNYVSTLNKEHATFALPTLTNATDIFSLNPISKSLDHGTVILHFKIPIIQNLIFTEYAVISVPDEDNSAVILSNGELGQRVAIDNENKTFFDIEKAAESYKSIYEKARVELTDKCLRDILLQKPRSTLKQSCSFVSRLNAQSKDGIFFLREDRVVIFKSNTSEISVKCEDYKESLNSRVTIVHFPNCTIISQSHNISANHDAMALLKGQAKTATIDLTPPKIQIKEVTEDPRIRQLHDEIRNELDNSDKWLNNSWMHSAAGTGFVMTIVGYIAWKVFQYCNKRPRRQRAPEVSSPEGSFAEIIELSEVPPRRWVSDWLTKKRTQPQETQEDEHRE